MDNLNDRNLPVIQILERASSSSFYAERLADLVENQGLLSAPANLKSSVLARTRQLDIKLVAGSNRLSKKLALWYYEVKVTLAVACCVGFIISAPGAHKKYLSNPVHTEANEIIQEFSEKVDGFSKRLWEMEVESNDKQKE